MRVRVLGLLWLLAMSSIAAPANWYVDGAAPGPTHDGTSWNNAWLDLTNIVWASVNAGDTINVSQGKYGELNPTKSGTEGAPITIKSSQEVGHNGGVTNAGMFTSQNWIHLIGAKDDSYTNSVTSTILVPQITNNINWHVITTNTPNTDGGGTCIGISGTGTNGIVLRWLELMQLSDHQEDYGVRFNYSGAQTQWSNEVSYCWIHNVGQDGIKNAAGATVSAFDATVIKYCLIELVGDDGVELNNGYTVANCIIRNARDSINRGHPDGISGQSWNWSKFYNNIVWGFRRSECFYPNTLLQGSTNLWIYGNLVYWGDTNTQESVKTTASAGMEDLYWSPQFAHIPGTSHTNLYWDGLRVFNNTFASYPTNSTTPFALYNRYKTASTQGVTCDPTADTLTTASDNGLAVGDVITISAGTLPTGLTAGDHTVTNVTSSTVFQLDNGAGGIINFSTAGSSVTYKTPKTICTLWTTNVLVFNNVFYSGLGGAFGAADNIVCDSSVMTLGWNNAWSTNEAGKGYQFTFGSYATGEAMDAAIAGWYGDTSAQPTFTSPGNPNWDYTIAAGDSALIAKGTNLSAYSTLMTGLSKDLWGTTRGIAGASWSIGANEYPVDTNLIVWLRWTNDFSVEGGKIVDSSSWTNNFYRLGITNASYPSNFLTSISHTAYSGGYTGSAALAWEYFIQDPDPRAAFETGTWAAHTNNMDQFTNMNQMSFAVWVAADTQRNNYSATVLDAGHANYGCWSFGRYFSQTPTNNFLWTITTNYAGAGSWDRCLSLVYPNDQRVYGNQWHYYAGTFSNGVCNIYFDGTNCGSTTLLVISNLSIWPSSNNEDSGSGQPYLPWISVGCRTHNGNPYIWDWSNVNDYPNNGWFSGGIGEVKIWNRTLTADEVLASYQPSFSSISSSTAIGAGSTLFLGSGATIFFGK